MAAWLSSTIWQALVDGAGAKTGCMIWLLQLPDIPLTELTVEEGERFMRLNAMWCRGLGPSTQNVLEKLEHPNKVCSLVHGNAVFLVMTNAPQRCEVITL